MCEDRDHDWGPVSVKFRYGLTFLIKGRDKPEVFQDKICSRMITCDGAAIYISLR